ncbi:DUF2163 domain-containing protein [Sphingomonas donggukensis]|uniref:DUF2163 domain-containing protein n=1 Tax=Sphingomonas donggukensis TaxID=2949093 RepID=A0ABY4TY36_9SPHN|nr:DUF2163 domain-containing protein [Sphingomonas donggukensis]URW75456.1 DUF2163 domain-containing protein [Sphingomonas donggukensis]
MSWLDEDITTLAICWRLERRDGIAIGLTDHDRDLVIDGNLYRASPGMTPSAIRRGEGADSVEVAGALTSAAISERDLIGGRWDGARVAVFAVDWTDTANRVALGEGSIGAVETGEGGFTAELRGRASRLERPVAEETTPECRAELGDRRCRVAMAGRQQLARVVASDAEIVTLDSAVPIAGGWGGGRLRWVDGANAGIEQIVAASAGADATLRTLPPFAVAVGDRVEVIEGCDKSLATCSGRFANVANFRGEPYLPGIDLLTRFPGA